ELSLNYTRGRARTLLWRGPLWRGERVERLVVDLSGGLGDIVRYLPVLAAIVRSGRVAHVVARVAREPGWFRDRLPGVEVQASDERIEADAGLCAIHELPRSCWSQW